MSSQVPVKQEPISNIQTGLHITYESQMKIWCLESKKELIKTARNNLNKRLIKFLSVIRSNNKLKQFNISQLDINKMINGCCDAISSWNGVDIELCKQQKTSYKEYRKTATNWFNRNKAKIFGNHFFFPLIWNHLLNFIHEIKQETDGHKICLLVDTLLLIFAENIHFARTKCQPLIPYQSVIQPNSFKSQCINFIHFYDIIWDQSEIIPAKINRIYQKDKKRSKKIYDTFIDSLNKLKCLLINDNKYETLPFYKVNAMNNYTNNRYIDNANHPQCRKKIEITNNNNIDTEIIKTVSINNSQSDNLQQVSPQNNYNGDNHNNNGHNVLEMKYNQNDSPMTVRSTSNTAEIPWINNNNLILTNNVNYINPSIMNNNNNNNNQFVSNQMMNIQLNPQILSQQIRLNVADNLLLIPVGNINDFNSESRVNQILLNNASNANMTVFGYQVLSLDSNFPPISIKQYQFIPK